MRRALLFALAAAAVALPAAGQIAPAAFPHILVIVLDDVGVDQLSCYGEGADTANTPNICERLAANGFDPLEDQLLSGRHVVGSQLEKSLDD